MKRINVLLLSLLLAFSAQTQVIQVIGHQKISDTAGNFLEVLDDYDYLGNAVNGISDFDGDGVLDMAMGATLDDDGGTNLGAIYLLYDLQLVCCPIKLAIIIHKHPIGS